MVGSRHQARERSRTALPGLLYRDRDYLHGLDVHVHEDQLYLHLDTALAAGGVGIR